MTVWVLVYVNFLIYRICFVFCLFSSVLCVSNWGLVFESIYTKHEVFVVSFSHVCYSLLKLNYYENFFTFFIWRWVWQDHINHFFTRETAFGKFVYQLNSQRGSLVNLNHQFGVTFLNSTCNAFVKMSGLSRPTFCK